ncbi:mercuric transporter MerT family protein [Phreatobacter sp. HK31-P]
MANVDAGHQPITQPIPTPSSGALGGLGTAIGLSALLASSCCVVPLALAGLGAGGALFGGLAFLAQIRPWLLGGAITMLALGWLLFFRRSRSVACRSTQKCARPASPRLSLSLLTAGSLIVGLVLVWETYLEPILLMR